MSTISRVLSVVLLGSIIVILSVPAAAQGPHIWGTSAAEVSTDPGFEGLWKYCLDIEWDASDMGDQGMSHISLFLGFGLDCPCACDEGIFAAADTAGSGPGIDPITGEPCTVYYHTSFLCEGDPNFPSYPYPTIKAEYHEGSCEPDLTGTANICFYSSFGPTDPDTTVGALGIKAGTQTELGDLVGVLPLCECGSPVENSTWGTVKSLYR